MTLQFGESENVWQMKENDHVWQMKEKDHVLQIKERDHVKIYMSEKEDEAVKLAVKNLCRDIENVCGAVVQLTQDVQDIAKIVVQTIGIQEKTSMRIDVTELQEEEGSLRKEAFYIHEKSGVLYITGSDRRGTIYGVYDFCEYIGVSPWYWFADVPIKKRKYIAIQKNYRKADYPSIPYRGIFINDEEELEAWSKTYFRESTIGPKTYEKIFELLLRLKANYIWPAMHVSAFNRNLENGKLANRMGVIVGTSHCDMLLRNNQNEWMPWLKEHGYEAEYDYSIPGRNREIIEEYWRESVEQNREHEVSYTIGMRGIHDSGFVTKKIDALNLNQEDYRKEKVQLLEQVINRQRLLIQEVINNKNQFQIFVPYKEVLSLYNHGLEVPEDVTLIWTNDNYGYVRRYPNEEERKRKGGNGLYYHISYWATGGMSYLFISSTPLAMIKNELKKAYDNGIRKLWVLNVGAIKPLEQDITFYFHYAWNIGKKDVDVTAFTKDWINKNFSGGHGKEVADIYNTFAQITNVRKLEHMKSNVFSQTAYGNEAARRMNCYKKLFQRTAEIHQQLQKMERDSFLQLFAMKVYAAYFVNASFYYGDRSSLMYNQGRMRDADECIQLLRIADKYKRNLLDYYNHHMEGGKWNQILTPEEFAPPCMALFPAGKPALVRNGNEVMVNESEIQEKSVHQIYQAESGYSENDGCISMLASHFTRNDGWDVIPHLGRYEGDLMQAGCGMLEYECNFTSEGSFFLELYRFPSLNTVGRLRIGVSVDDGQTALMESLSNDEWKGNWKENVRNHVEKLYLTLPVLTIGKHSIKLHAVDPYVAFSKLVIYTKGYIKSNLGPCESYHAVWNRNYKMENSTFEMNKAEVEELFLKVMPNANAATLDMLYAGKDYWNVEPRVFYRASRGPWPKEEPQYICDENGCKNIVTKLHKGIFSEHKGQIKFGAEEVLQNSSCAYQLTDPSGIKWEHMQSESDAGTGLAMHVAQEGMVWNSPENAPSMNYRIRTDGGKYYIWLLLKYDDPFSACCYISIDGQTVPQEQMSGNGNLFNYGTKQRWIWMLITEASIAKGEHLFTIQAKASQLRIDQICLTRNDGNPVLE